MTPGFRWATVEDVRALVDLVESAYRGERSRAGWCSEADLLDGQRVDVAMMREVLADPEAEVLVLEQDGAVVACCELSHPDDGRTSHLGMFAVDPARQANGLGRRVLTEAERIAAGWGAEHLELLVIDLREPLIEWYERCGFRRTGGVEPFPYGDERFGLPRRDDLRFAVLAKPLRALQPTVRRLVGVYDAEGTLRGELAYWVGARLGRAHCALCDITHGLARARPEWRRCRDALPVPFDTYHRDDQPEEVRAAVSGRAPVVVAETDVAVIPLLDPGDLERCQGSVERLALAVDAAVRAAGLGWPG